MNWCDTLIKHKEASIMRKFLIISAVTLLAFGCDKKEDQGTSTGPQSMVAGEQMAETSGETISARETRTDEATVTSTADPVFKDYVYPNSKLEDTISMGNTTSAIYKSSDGFVKVMDFYKQKFPDAPLQPGTTVYFGKTNADGSGLTVTLTKLDNEIQIILRHDKKI
jgi:hypothetical protein